MRLFSLFGLFAAVVMSLSVMGCEEGLYQYHDVGAANPELMARHKVIEFYVDEGFSVSERKVIAASLEEWNYALNNSMRLEVKTWGLKRSEQKATAAMIDNTNNGIMMVKYNSDDEEMTQYGLKDGVIAFSLGVGNSHLIVVLGDRIGGIDLKTVVSHEIGHSLGAFHVSSRQSLMFPYAEVPYAGGMQSPCIDKITLSQVAGYNHLDMKYLNYCSTEDFP